MGMGTDQQASGESDEGEAPRRTYLALERTYLAWWRTGLAALAVGLAVGRIVPDLAHAGVDWPYVAAGAVFGVLGLTFIVVGTYRQRSVERAMAGDGFARLDPRLVLVLEVVGIVLGLAIVALVVY